MSPESATLDLQAALDNLPFPSFRRGKVRDVFDLGDRLLLVATDRLSTFDVVMPTSIPAKGEMLTAISNGWFDRTKNVIPNHLTGDSLADLGLPPEVIAPLIGRSVIGRKADRIDIECVVRSHLAGTGWKEYQASGTLAGEPLPAGLRLGDALPELRFTPAAKNDVGHDENISRAQLAEIVGAERARQLESVSLELFRFARDFASRVGFILADTKFEFGLVDGELILIDELLTPDSSRYWDATVWQPGMEPPSFDKQIIRDWVERTGWNKQPPGPEIPDDIVASAADKYRQVRDRLQAIEEGTAR